MSPQPMHGATSEDVVEPSVSRHRTPTRTIAVANQKGGVGKTTSTVNIAAALGQAGFTVLVIDLDPQGNASTALGISHTEDTVGVYEVLIEGTSLAAVARPAQRLEHVWCVPSTIDVAGAEVELVGIEQREYRLKTEIDRAGILRSVTGTGSSVSTGATALPEFDYVLIDCPPSLGLLTINALTAVREVLIPIQCEYYALEGLTQLMRNIGLIGSHLNPTLSVSAILMTMFDGRTKLSSQVAREVRSHFGNLVLSTTIPRSVRISEAPSHGQTVLTYDPMSAGALSYRDVAVELSTQDALPPRKGAETE
ncbi:MAG: AAA family ATPase [Ornithinimicrobium sp.]